MERQAIIKGSALLTLSGYISGFLWYIFFLVAARWLGVEDFGKLAFALTFVALFRFTMDIGLSQLAQREIARDPGLVDEYFSNVMCLKLLLFLLSVSLIAALIYLLNYPPVVRKIVYILSIAEGLNSFSEFFRSIFRANQKMGYEAVIWVMERVIVLSIAIWVLYVGGGILSVSMTVLFTSLLKFLAGLTTVIKRFLRGFERPSLEFSINAARKGILIGLAAMLALVFFQIDTVMLSLMVGDRAVGLYNASYKILEGMLILPAAFAGVLYPLFSSIGSKNDAKFISVSQTSLKYMLMITLPMVSFVTMMAAEIMSLIYGSNYSESSNSLRVLVWTLLFHSILTVQHVSLLAMGEEKRLIGIYSIAAVFNVIMNLLLIPELREIGAALATVISEMLLWIITAYLLSTLKIKIPLPFSTLNIGLIVAVLTVINISVKSMSLIFLVPLMSFAYIFVYILSGLLSISDINMLLSGRAGKYSEAEG